jgi:hypothetical protein
MSAHVFRVWGLPPISKAQIDAACDAYEREAEHGFAVNDIADRLQWTRGTACVVRRWSIERAAGQEVQP